MKGPTELTCEYIPFLIFTQTLCLPTKKLKHTNAILLTIHVHIMVTRLRMNVTSHSIIYSDLQIYLALYHSLQQLKDHYFTYSDFLFSFY
jgi:hypothetical protein